MSNSNSNSSNGPKKRGFFSRLFGLGDSQESSSKESNNQRGRGGREKSGGGRRRSDGGGGGSRGGGGGRRRSSRGPELREVTGTRLYIGNLSYDATEEDLEELFRGVGNVESAEVVTHRRTQRSKGFAFVEMSGIDMAKRAADELHDTEFMGRRLVVTGAKPPEHPRD